jgi:hypothetical protein
MKYLITIPAICLALLLTTCVANLQARADTLQVSTRLAGIDLDTEVDSVFARDALLSERQELDGVPPLSCNSLFHLPDAKKLRAITRAYSVDTATALLVQCLANNPDIAHSQKLFLEQLERVHERDSFQTQFISARASDYVVLVVPGWGYLDNADLTGADLATQRELLSSLGIENHLLPVPSNGSVEAISGVIVERLKQYLAGDKRVILVSASSGGPAVVQALRKPEVGNHPLLVGWLNICGVIHGSPVIDHFTTWPGSWLLRIVSLFEGWEYKNLLSLSREHGRERYAGFEPPLQLMVLNYVGIPFSDQVSPLGRRMYNMLSKHGPNDGLTLITEALVPGYAVLSVGQDHFIAQDSDIAAKSAALIPTLLMLIEQRERLNPSVIARRDHSAALTMNSSFMGP